MWKLSFVEESVAAVFSDCIYIIMPPLTSPVLLQTNFARRWMIFATHTSCMLKRVILPPSPWPLTVETHLLV